MKYILVIFLALLASTAFTQSLSFGLKSSYAFSRPNSIIGEQNELIYDTEYSVSNIRGSLASGVLIELFSELKIHENVRLSLGVDHLFGNSILFNNYTASDTSLQLFGKLNQQRILPGINFIFPTKKISFFVSNSLVLPINTSSQFEETRVVKAENKFYSNQISKLTYGFSFGVRNELGIEYDISNNFKMRFALQNVFLKMKRRELNIESYEFGGEQKISSLSTYEKQTNYSENLNAFSNNAEINSFYSEDKPREELTKTSDFSSFSMGFSLVFTIPSKK